MTREVWIQIENKLWDMAPNGINRMTGERFPIQNIEQIHHEINTRGQVIETHRTPKEMYRPVEVLILRRYSPPDTAAGIVPWSLPLDRKVNPWDINEPDPSRSGGTIPGATLECTVGDRLVVHFRNMDLRSKNGKSIVVALRMHSLHPHGITFAPRYDGAFPISPLDLDQPISQDEIGYYKPFGIRHFHGGSREFFKRSDLVPPGGTFTYRWDTKGWKSTAGVWLYHDHSVADHYNVLHGAIGFIVIHDPNNPSDVNVNPDEIGEDTSQYPNNDVNGSIVIDGQYVNPSEKVQCLQLYHELPGAGMCINGRQCLGNTPTLVVGPRTLIRFGLGAMNNDTFHTFHLHGHRWNSRAAPGTPSIDTRIFGPADTFHFSIQEGSEEAPPLADSKGEWHMHCHVLHHMMGGMMGSLLIVEGADEAKQLPQGVKLPRDQPPLQSPEDFKVMEAIEISGSVTTDGTVKPVSDGRLVVKLRERSKRIEVADNSFDPPEVMVEPGTIVKFVFLQDGHTVTTDYEPSPIEFNAGRGPNDPVRKGQIMSWTVSDLPGTVVNYYCGRHGLIMSGVIRIIEPAQHDMDDEHH